MKRILIALFSLILVASFVILPTMPAAASYGDAIRITYSESEADQPDVAIDSIGNVHIAYCDWVGIESSYEIFYTMLDNNGNTLIDDTLITPDDDYKSKRPAIVVDSNDKVHIVWQDFRWTAGSNGEITYTKLDPYLDNRDGDPANESVITPVQDKMISDDNGGYSAHLRIAIDSDDNIHVVWDEYGELEGSDGYWWLFYKKIDSNGNEVIGDTVVATSPEYEFWRPSVSVAVDSNNNAHIAWNDEEDTSTYETYYKMLDGSDGSTLIDRTLITPDDDYKSKRQSIVVDFQDKVHIIWQDQRGSDQQIFYTKLDPSLADQIGDPADDSVIRVIDDTALTPDDDEWRNHPTSAIHCGHYIHITWYEDWEEKGGPGYLHYMILDNDGNTVVSDTPLITNKTATTTTKWTMAYLDVDSNGKAHIVWCDDRDGYYEVYYTTFQGPACPLPPPVGGELYPVNKLSILAPWLTLALLLAVGGGFMIMRRRQAV